MNTKTEEWYDCYKKGWKGVVTEDAFKHPAKFGYGLIQRMIQHAIDIKAIQRGGLVVDPFGGVGCGGIMCAYNHLRWIGCELEQKFHDIAIANFKLHRQKWINTGRPLPVIINGDSRNLAKLLKTQCDVIISSPPYADMTCRIKNSGIKNAGVSELHRSSSHAEYGYSDGQLGRMRAGQVDAIISSPPFEGVVAFQDKSFRTKQGKMFNKTQSIEGTYGSGSPNQLGNQKGETFWSAAQDIVRQCRQVLKPNGLCIWVCKDYIKNKQRVTFSDDWQRLCEANGFKLCCRHKAMLKKQWKTGVLFGNDTKKKERKSFFRKLIERKGAPEINWEDIICMEKV